MDSKLFGYSPITEREPIRWPGGARVAFYVGLNELLDQTRQLAACAWNAHLPIGRPLALHRVGS